MVAFKLKTCPNNGQSRTKREVEHQSIHEILLLNKAALARSSNIHPNTQNSRRNKPRKQTMEFLVFTQKPNRRHVPKNAWTKKSIDQNRHLLMLMENSLRNCLRTTVDVIVSLMFVVQRYKTTFSVLVSCLLQNSCQHVALAVTSSGDAQLFVCQCEHRKCYELNCLILLVLIIIFVCTHLYEYLHFCTWHP